MLYFIYTMPYEIFFPLWIVIAEGEIIASVSSFEINVGQVFLEDNC